MLVHPEPKYGAARLSPPPQQGRVEERTSIAVQLGAYLNPLAVLYLGEEGFIRTLMLGRAEAHGRGTEDIVVIFDAFQPSYEAIGREVAARLLQRQDHQLPPCIADLGSEVGRMSVQFLILGGKRVHGRTRITGVQ